MTATFTALQYTLTVTTEGSGTVTSTPAGIACGSECAASFTALSTVTLTATPASGREFIGWDGACPGANTTCLVEMKGAKSVTASFGERRIVITSTSGGIGGPDCTLRDAITAANADAPKGGCRAGNGDDVIVLPEDAIISLFEIDNNVSGNNGLPSISTPITIRGSGATIERGSTEAKSPVFHVGAGGRLTIENMTVANGHGMRLGGGALLLDSGQAVVIASSITGNVADTGDESLGAGIVNLRGSLTVDQSTFTRNGLQNPSTTEGPSSGAAIAVVDGTATITRSSLTGNISENVGGIHSRGTASTVTISSSVISMNFGKAIHNEGLIWLTDVEIRNNDMETAAGGLTNSGSAYLERVTFENHEGEFLGTLINIGHMEISSSTISNNGGLTIDGRGGISNLGTMEISQTQILNNRSHDTGGGGILNFNGAELTVTGSLISGNSGSVTGEGSPMAVDWTSSIASSQVTSARSRAEGSLTAGTFASGGLPRSGRVRAGTGPLGQVEGSTRKVPATRSSVLLAP